MYRQQFSFDEPIAGCFQQPETEVTPCNGNDENYHCQQYIILYHSKLGIQNEQIPYTQQMKHIKAKTYFSQQYKKPAGQQLGQIPFLICKAINK